MVRVNGRDAGAGSQLEVRAGRWSWMWIVIGPSSSLLLQSKHSAGQLDGCAAIDSEELRVTRQPPGISRADSRGLTVCNVISPGPAEPYYIIQQVSGRAQISQISMSGDLPNFRHLPAPNGGYRSQSGWSMALAARPMIIRCGGRLTCRCTRVVRDR